MIHQVQKGKWSREGSNFHLTFDRDALPIELLPQKITSLRFHRIVFCAPIHQRFHPLLRQVFDRFAI